MATAKGGKRVKGMPPGWEQQLRIAPAASASGRARGAKNGDAIARSVRWRHPTGAGGGGTAGVGWPQSGAAGAALVRLVVRCVVVV